MVYVSAINHVRLSPSSSSALPTKRRMQHCLGGLHSSSFMFTPTKVQALEVMGVASTLGSEDSHTDSKRMFLFGLGYTASILGECLRKDGWHISGTCRSAEKRNLEEQGFDVYQFDSQHGGKDLKQDGIMALWNATHVLSTIPTTVDGLYDPVLGSHSDDLEYALHHRNLSWIGYLSSTGVYGDWQGEWVDEESEPLPFDKNATARLDAEKAWLLLGEKSKVPVHIFRIGGIYGPGRSALETILSKKPLTSQQIIRGSRRFTSRVHVADICQVIYASIKSPFAGRIYNVVDDDPAPRAEVLEFASNLLEKHSSAHAETGSNLVSPALQIQQAVDDSKNFRFTSQHEETAAKVPEKRVRNKRIKEELRVKLRYPTYRSGLEAILMGEGVICP